MWEQLFTFNYLYCQQWMPNCVETQLTKNQFGFHSKEVLRVNKDGYILNLTCYMFSFTSNNTCLYCPLINFSDLFFKPNTWQQNRREYNYNCNLHVCVILHFKCIFLLHFLFNTELRRNKKKITIQWHILGLWDVKAQKKNKIKESRTIVE